jgi:hypothetical protein
MDLHVAGTPTRSLYALSSRKLDSDQKKLGGENKSIVVFERSFLTLMKSSIYCAVVSISGWLSSSPRDLNSLQLSLDELSQKRSKPRSGVIPAVAQILQLGHPSSRESYHYP